MSLLQSDPPLNSTPLREFIVKAERIALLPRPWTWAIYEANGREALYRSSQSYQSAEDAWSVGNKVCGLLSRHGWRKPSVHLAKTMDSTAEATTRSWPE